MQKQLTRYRIFLNWKPMMSIRNLSLTFLMAFMLLLQTVSAQITNTSKRTIVVMGSSSAYGWKSSVPDSAFVNRLQADLHFYNRGDTIINIAYPGNTTYVCLPTGSSHPGYAPAPNTSQNVTAALKYHPTFVIICLPTNDIADGYTNTESLANYTKITNALTTAGVPFIITGTQPRDLATDAGCSIAFDGSSVCLSTGGLTAAEQADLATFNTKLTAQYPSNATYSTPIVNNYLTLLSASATNYEINPTISYGDGIHFTDAGHRIVYNTFLNFQLYKDLVNFNPTITLTLNPTSIGTADYAPGAVSNYPGLPITYTSSNPAVATITAGGLIHVVGIGTTNITATQPGDTHHLPASTTTPLVCNAATSYDWLGGVSTVWNNPNNWKSTNAGVTSNPATDYPGDLQSTDMVNIGVNNNYTNSPEVTATLPKAIASITIGDRLINGGATASNTLTVDASVVLNVSGQILQKHSTAGLFNSGNTAPVTAIKTNIQGSGTITCGSFSVGDNTTPTADSVVNITQVTLGAAAGGSHLKMNITGDLSLNTQSRDNVANTLVVSNSDAQFSLSQGKLTIGGHINLTDGAANAFKHAQFQPEALFSMDLHNNADSSTLILQNANALTSQTGNVGNKFDFYNVVQAGGAGVATVNYNGSNNQEVYNYVSGATIDNIIDNNGATPGDGYVYQNIEFGGTGTKTVDAALTSGALNVGHAVTLDVGSEIVDLSVNNASLQSGSDLTINTGSTLKFGTGSVTVGGSFYNYGTTNFGSTTVTFNSAGGKKMVTTNSCYLPNAIFTGGGTETMSGNNFFLKSQGLLQINGNTKLAANGYLTLMSDSTGSATVTAIPSGCTITGNVNVQRYVTKHRAYRLASSPVYSSTVGLYNIYSIKYLSRAIYTTGTTGSAGGFDKNGNPTIYLYRENLAPTYSTFLTSNFRGINRITDTLNYLLDVDGGPYNIPVGNGFMFYYRGSRKQATMAKLTTPGAAATNDTLTATGILNQGTITVRDWYTASSSNLGNTTVSGNVAIEGVNLVGNPYASSIDWDQYSATNSSAGIYAPNVAKFCYQLIPSGAQGSGNYGVYSAGSSGLGGTNGATNIIGSGVGFFVQATGALPQLIFSESAKTNTQAVVGSTLFMGKPVDANVSNQYIRLQLAKDSINSDESIIRFDKSSTTAFNPINDAMYRTGTGAVSISTISSDNVPLAISQVPFPKNKQTLAIPLKIGASADGNYQLKLTAINQVPMLYDIWLVDTYKKDSVDLRKSPLYNFAIAKADSNSFGSARFRLDIREDSAYAYKLLNFTGAPAEQGTQVQLNWTTVNEQNYTNFTVQRSINNSNAFTDIGILSSSNSGNYGLVDKSPAYGQNVYRLMQQDIDGNITYSNTVDINIIDRSSHPVSLYPNPTRNVINLTINVPNSATGKYRVMLSNSLGIVVRSATLNQASWGANVSDLLTGTYLIQVVNTANNSLVGQAKFVKL